MYMYVVQSYQKSLVPNSYRSAQRAKLVQVFFSEAIDNTMSTYCLLVLAATMISEESESTALEISYLSVREHSKATTVRDEGRLVVGHLRRQLAYIHAMLGTCNYK